MRILSAAAMLSFLVAGCGTMATVHTSRFRPYSGVAASAKGHATQIDIPFSFVADTILLPVSIPTDLSRRSWMARSETDLARFLDKKVTVAGAFYDNKFENEHDGAFLPPYVRIGGQRIFIGSRGDFADANAIHTCCADPVLATGILRYVSNDTTTKRPSTRPHGNVPTDYFYFEKDAVSIKDDY